MQPKDWTLLVISEGGEKSLQPVQLQKALFLIERNLSPKELTTGDFYRFCAYDYGPFCRDVYDDAESLWRSGLVAIDVPEGARFRHYRTTEPGRIRADELRAKLAPTAKDYLSRVVEFTLSLTFNQLVQAIYKAYPDMKAHSVFQE